MTTYNWRLANAWAAWDMMQFGQFMATESTDLTQFMVVWDIEINPEWPNNSGLEMICRPDVFMLYMYILCRSMYTSPIGSFLFDLLRDGCNCLQRCIVQVIWRFFDIVSILSPKITR